MDNKDWKQSHARTDRDGIEPYQPGREPPLLAELSQCQSISEKIPNGRWRKAPSRRPAPEDLHLLSVSVFRTEKRLRPDEDWQIPTAPWSRNARSSGDRRASIRNLLKVGLAHSERFELPTLGIEIRCSIQLSYECLRARLPDLAGQGQPPFRSIGPDNLSKQSSQGSGGKTAQKQGYRRPSWPR